MERLYAETAAYREYVTSITSFWAVTILSRSIRARDVSEKKSSNMYDLL